MTVQHVVRGVMAASLWLGGTAWGGFGAFDVPPIVVSSLDHDHSFSIITFETTTVDAVQFPCAVGECNGPGFTAALGDGTAVNIRIEAPPGKRFQVTHTPGATNTFTINALWQTFQGGGTFGNNETPTVFFENLIGFAPSNPTVSLHGISNGGHSLRTHLKYEINGGFNFTAVDIRFNLNNPETIPVFRMYGPVGSGSFGLTRVVEGVASDAILMNVANAPLPVAVVVPPVTVSEFTTTSLFYDVLFDETSKLTHALFPCTIGTCYGPGFSDSISTTDFVLTRFQAHAGKRIVVTHRPTPTTINQRLSYDATWSTGAIDDSIHFFESAPVLEGLRGTPPVLGSTYNKVSDDGQRLTVEASYSVMGNFSFTAIRNEFQVLNQVSNVLRTYGAVTNGAIGAGHLALGDTGDPGVLIRVAPPCPADVEYSESVNVQDLLAIIGAWGPCANPSACPADIAPTGGDDVVNVQDLLAVIGAWGACP